MMLISDLIIELQNLKEKHGNLPVYCLVPGYDNSEEDEHITKELITHEDIHQFNPIERIMIGR